MSAPGRTYFCRNGHITASYGHGELGPDDYLDVDREDGSPCSICGSKKIKQVCEWGDEGYRDRDWPSYEPIREDDLAKMDHYGNKYYVKVNVYDVRRLFKIK